MPKKMFSTPVDIEISDDFRNYCKTNKLKMTDVIEQFMKAIVDGSIQLKVKSEMSFNTKK